MELTLRQRPPAGKFSGWLASPQSDQRRGLFPSLSCFCFCFWFLFFCFLFYDSRSPLYFSLYTVKYQELFRSYF